SILKEMSNDERAIFQELVDEAFDRFKGIVKEGRPKLSDENVKEIATGQVFTASQAIKYGLVDAEGFMDDAVDHAAKLAGLDKDKVRVVRYQQPVTLMEVLMQGQAQSQKPSMNLQALLELSTPRAYYLCSWVPGLHGDMAAKP
ncbi:MAG: S49 family peptidase, partial [Planctomycetales bacterium]